MSDFQRPRVQDWMSPPKSSNLKNLDLDPASNSDGSSSPGWSTPPQSYKANSDQHFSLHLSPDVSITLHSPKSVNAYVSSTNDAGSKKFSLKILSPKSPRKRTPTEELLSSPVLLTDPPEFDEVSNVDAKTVHKMQLKEFIPPHFNGVKDAKMTREKTVKRLQITDFQIPHASTKVSPRKQPSPEIKPAPLECRKRHIDVKSARDYIQTQKRKRKKIAIVEKTRKKIDSEERKKKLEELRVRTLQLAATARKKSTNKPTSPQIKTVENEEELTLSLGLRQVRPKRSFHQAVASLGQPVQAVLPPKQEEIIEECPKENYVPVVNCSSFSATKNLRYNKEMQKLSDRLVAPKKNKDASESLLKLADALEKKLAEKRSRRKMTSIENIVGPKRSKTVAVDAEAIACLTNEIKEIASGFQQLQTVMTRDDKTERKRSPDWLLNIEPYPYNIFTAVQNKMRAPGNSRETKVEECKEIPSVSSQSQRQTRESGSSEPSSSILDSEQLISEKSISERISQLSSYKPNVVLMPTDIKLNNTVKELSRRSESISTQVIDNLSGTSEKEEKVSNLLSRPDPFQALLDSEFHILDNLQQTLARFVETKRGEKAVNTAKYFNDRSVQTGVDERNSPKTDLESIKTESSRRSLSQSIQESIRKTNSYSSSKIDESIKAESSRKSLSDTIKSERRKSLSENIEELFSKSETESGISLKVLARMIKDEEIRSEHQMALIQLRQHALVEKTKTCLTELEEKKKFIKDGSVIKKKQRAVLLKYQSEQQEIERLKRMHQIASEERRSMMKEHELIQQMQMSSKDIELKLDESVSEIVEQVESQASSSDSINTFIHHSNVVSEDESITRDQDVLRERIKRDDEKLNKCKKLLGEKEEKLMQQKHFVEEILEWERRLDAEETRIKEMKRRALKAAKTSVVLSSDTPSKTIDEVVATESGADEIPEEIPSKTTSTIRSYASESFESSSKSLPSKLLPIVKPVLSPRHGTRRRCSSGSDDSANLSHTETTSEPSDVECRLKALEEQLKNRKMEADRLRREHKRKQRERLKEKEESLKKQIKAYDAYIDKLKQEVAQETQKASPLIKPIIKQPRAEKIQIAEKSESTVEEKISTESTIESESQIVDNTSLVESIEDVVEISREEVSEKITSAPVDSYETDSFESDDEKSQLPATQNIDFVVDKLMQQILAESLDIAGEILQNRRSKTAEAVSEFLFNSTLNESLDCVIDIFTNKRKSCDGIPGDEITLDVRRRIHEIMGAGQMALRNRICDQSTLQTTYDVSPSNSPTNEDASGLLAQEQFISSLSPKKHAKEVHVSHDSDGQEWFDEDFGLTKSRREAEALRLQQLQIEQEIEELQAQQDQVPYFYVREIPNKPPPPYTPPGKLPSANAPTSEAEISRQMRTFSRNTFKILHGLSSSVNPRPQHHHFTQCLWDLAQELVSEVCSGVPEVTEEPLPWKQHPLPLARWRQSRRSLREDVAVEQVVNRSLMLFGLRPRVAQETLIVRWSRKKRDHVDELLVWDSQAEEAEWTWYDRDVVDVKNELTDQLMDSLLLETASAFNAIFRRKKGFP